MLAAGPLVTEFMAVNRSTLADGNGDFSDWLEIHNPTAAPISLGGWYLTDDVDDLTQWPLPAVEMAAGEYLVVFASGQLVDDFVDSKGFFHTNFKLDGDGNGESVLLVEPDGRTFDNTFLDYPSQDADISYGISIDGVSKTLVTSVAPLAYRVPTAGENVTAWTAVGFNAAGFTNEQSLDGAGLLIAEVDTGDDKKFVEIQNVSAEAIDTSGWTVAVNNPAGGVNGVVGTAWSLPASVDAAEILYRTDQIGDEYWGSAIPWQLEGPGWAMIVDDAGAVRDFVAWGYTAAEIDSISVDVGAHANITLADHWSGNGAEVGSSGAAAGETVTVGPGSGLAGAGSIDSAGARLNVEPSFAQTLAAGTYNVQDISFASSSNGVGQLRAFLAVLTGGGPTYEIIWASAATTPASGSTIHTVAYAGDAEQFTLDADADVYAGVWHDGAAKVRFSGLSTTTNHDSTPSIPTAAGQTVSGFSHPTLNGRTYAYHITVGAAVGATSLQRVGFIDGDSAIDFVRSNAPTVGRQNPDSAPLFGGVVPTTAGIGFSDDQPLLDDLIQTDVAEAMRSVNASLWTRFEFSSDGLAGFDELTLSVRYDDGFVAYLDGVEVARMNAPEALAYNSAATASRTDSAAGVFDDFDLSDELPRLTRGAHVLAVHVLNASAADGDLLFQPTLIASADTFGQFFDDATPGEASTAAGFNEVGDTTFSVDRGFYDAPFDVEITSSTPNATIVYTLDGSAPTVNSAGAITNGTQYTAPLNINRTTTLRAMAARVGLRSTNVDTQTYLFVDDIVTQTRQSIIAAGFPSSWGGRGSADYGLDPDVIGPNDRFGGVYAESIRDDLKSLPTLSIVMNRNDVFGSNGIYSNIQARGVGSERATSVELIYPDGRKGFQINAGIRPHGGASRSLSRKNSLRLLFKEEYGPTKLDFPLFGDGVDRFDTIVVRPTFNDGWGWSGAGGDPLFARDEWHRQTQAAMGSTASRGIFVHLYINGLYWGLYNPIERADASFSAQHLGGDKTEWDAINHHGTVDGSSAAWNTMRSLAAAVGSASGAAAKWDAYQRIQGNDSNGNNDPRRENYLDVENYIDYLLLSFYSGNNDWPGNNWYASRRRGPESEGFQFFAWDSEISMTLSGRTNIFDNRTGQIGGVTVAYGSLRSYSEFRLAFADRVHKHMFNGGALYVDPDNPEWDPDHPERNLPAARMVKITDEIRDAVVAESARWGDMHRSTPYTRNAEWERELNELLVDTPGNSQDGFFTVRWGIALGHLRGAGLYPATAAPEFEIGGVRQHGGSITPGDRLSFQNTNAGGAGTVYYTLDGSDPRLPLGAVNDTALTLAAGGSIPIGESLTIKARILRNGDWSALSEATFLSAPPTLTISELHYNPADPPEGQAGNNDDFEFIEVFNYGVVPVELDGVRLTNGVDFDFSGSVVASLAAGEYAVVVRDLAAFSSRYDTAGMTIIGEYLTSGNRLSNAGEKIELVDAFGQTISKFRYKDGWYNLTDGEGFSLSQIDPSDVDADLGESAAWRPSSDFGGSPGRGDSFSVPAPGAVVVNEVLANSNAPLGDWIELLNTTDAAINIGGWFLSNDRLEPNKYEIPIGTTLPAGGLATFTETQHFGASFTLSELGDDVIVQAASGGALLGFRAREDFDGSDQGVTFGRFIKTTGGKDFVALQSATFGTANAPPLVGPVVIHEVMYNPGDDNNAGSEFVELMNISGAPVSLDGWNFDAIGYVFGSDVVIEPGGLVVVVPLAPAEFRATHNVPDEAQVFGPYLGALDNAGESLRLNKPGDPVGELIPSIMVDRVSYRDKLPWPVEADGTGVALQRIAPDGYGNEPTNWGITLPGGTPGDFVILPTVVEVLISGSGWSAAMLERLSAAGSGDGGFSIPAGADQLQSLAWVGIDRISIRFSESVDVTSGDLRVAGANVSRYDVVDFSYDRPSLTASWTLGQPIRSDKLLIELSAAVRDQSGLLLDGNWVDETSSFPSGNGVIDGDGNNDDAFRFRFNVVAGDVTSDGRVDRADLVDLIHSLGDRSISPDSLRHDLNGDGLLDVADLRAALSRIDSRLPSGAPVQPGSIAPRAAVDVLFERLGAASPAAIPQSVAARASFDRDDRPLREETPAFRRRLGGSRGRSVSSAELQHLRLTDENQ